MKAIAPVFKDDRDKLVAVATIILSLFFMFIPALLVVIFLREKISEGTYNIAKAFFNFELLLFLIFRLVVPQVAHFKTAFKNGGNIK